MKYFVIFLIGLCILAFTNGDSSSSEEDLLGIANKLKRKFNVTVLLDIIKIGDKIKEKCPEIDEKMESTAEKVTQCLHNIELGSDTFCSLIKENAPTCAKHAIELMETCMPDESKGIPLMVEKIILAIFDQACHSTVEEMLEWLNPCSMQKNPMTFPACKEVQHTIEENRSKFPSKSILCQTIPKMKVCIKAVLDDSCPNPITKQAHIKMQDAMDKAIKDECDAIGKV